jgi:hypothetical protein
MTQAYPLDETDGYIERLKAIVPMWLTKSPLGGEISGWQWVRYCYLS